MITRGLGKNGNIVSRGFGTALLVTLWRELRDFSVYIKKIINIEVER